MKLKARSYAKEIKNNVIPKDTKIDVVISSACPFIEMLFGYELKKLLGCKWISDFRDLPFVEDSTNDAQIMKKIMISSLKNADAVTTIAKTGKEFLGKNIVDNPEKIHVITNGFSMTDAREPLYQDDKRLHIVHTGSLYGGTRKADLFFKAAQIARQKCPDFSYVLECAGGNNESLIETAKKYGEESNVDNRGFIPRKEALEMQSKADMLLALICKTVGSFSAKIFEYTLNKKPIICVSCGTGEIGEETAYIRELNLGIAVEESSDENDVHQLSEYLLRQYELKSKSCPLFFEPNDAGIAQYDHDELVKRIESLC
jgi:glycosyltransferase involved in cell wall biosynthesis